MLKLTETLVTEYRVGIDELDYVIFDSKEEAEEALSEAIDKRVLSFSVGEKWWLNDRHRIFPVTVTGVIHSVTYDWEKECLIMETMLLVEDKDGIEYQIYQPIDKKLKSSPELFIDLAG